MKYLMLILICLLALGACQVTYAEEASTAIPQQKLVNLDLKDTPLKNAIEMLFKESGYNYALSSDLNKPPFSSLQLNLKLQNVSFEAALSSLTKAANLMWSTDKNDNKVFTISPTASQPSMPPPPPQPTYGPNSAPSGPNPNQQPEPDKNLITMRIPPMPIIHALQKVDPGWGFSPENLENKAMPGASFYNFPREGAAYVLMIAAGLVPPSDSGKTITQSGKANLQDYFQWKPAASEAAPVDSSGQSGFGGSYGGGSYGGTFRGHEPSSPASIAIAAYNTADKGQRYVVLLSQALDIDALENLLATSGKNYTIDDLRNRYAVSKIVQSVGNGKLVESEQIVNKPWRYISAQLFNVTLDEALNNLINAAGLKYRKEGTGENTTYIIENPSKAIWDRGAANSSTIKPAPKSSTTKPAPKSSSIKPALKSSSAKPADSAGFGGSFGGGRMGF